MDNKFESSFPEKPENGTRKMPEKTFESWKTRIETMFSSARTAKDDAQRIKILEDIKRDAGARHDELDDKKQRDFFFNSYLAAKYGLEQLTEPQIDSINEEILQSAREKVESGEPLTDKDVKVYEEAFKRQKELRFGTKEQKAKESSYLRHLIDRLFGK